MRRAPASTTTFRSWSPDDAFIYFVHGVPLDEMDMWRIRPAGGEAERLTSHNSRVTFPTLLDARTLLYLATDEQGGGPWIYAMDVERRVVHRVSTGVEEYTSLGASADGRRLVATISRSAANLWRVADREIIPVERIRRAAGHHAADVAQRVASASRPGTWCTASPRDRVLTACGS